MVRRIVSKDGPHPVDIEVGRRARECRTLEGMSQTAVAEKLGLTFQQLQKYERGHNRISASRLYELAQLFDVPVSYFFNCWNVRPSFSAACARFSPIGRLTCRTPHHA